jgi:hypothetical protein
MPSADPHGVVTLTPTLSLKGEGFADVRAIDFAQDERMKKKGREIAPPALILWSVR